MNTALGNTTLYQNTTGSQNTAMGHWAMFNNLSGNNNVALGYYALKNNVVGYSNVAVGHSAAFRNLYASNTVAIGDSALYYSGQDPNTNLGAANIAVGSKSLFNNTTGYNNTATGYQSLFTNADGSGNTAMGYNALFSNTSGGGNVAFGYRALYNTTTGIDNVAVGTEAFSNNTNGKYNTALGSATNNTVDGLIRATAIGFGATVSTSYKIRLGDNSVTVVEGPVAYTVSDGRFKKNIASNVPGLDFIKNLKPVTYQYESYQMDRFLNQNNPSRQAQLKKEEYQEAESLVHMGFVAQDVEQLIKAKGYHLSVVHAPANPTDNYSLAYGELVVPLVKAVQEQQAIIEKQQATIDQQNKAINELLNRMQALEAAVKK